MKNVFLVFLGGLLLAIVGADWNSASWQVNAMLMVIGLAAIAVGILAAGRTMDATEQRIMASSVDGLPPPRTKTRMR